MAVPSRPNRPVGGRAAWVLGGVVVLALVLIPFVLWGDAIEQWTRRALAPGVSAMLAAAVVVGLLASDVVLPVPSSFVGTASGALLGFVNGTIAAWIGMCLSCAAGYWIGRRASSLAQRTHGHTGDVARVSAASERMGDWVVVVFRAVPVLAEASIVWAGAAEMPITRFAVLAAGSNLGVAAGYAAIGALGAGKWAFLSAFVGGIAVPGALMLAVRRRRPA